MSDLYKGAGVDIDMGEKLVDWLKTQGTSSSTAYGKPLAGIGGFASLFQVDFSKLKKPALVASTDGVGTKLLLGLQHDILKGLGVDLVAMCINDLYTLGATPLFFLDYYACGKLNESQFQDVLSGIHNGLSQANCPLIGGETAELPGLYEGKHFDLAGFVIGVVDADSAWGENLVKDGDLIYALPSDGFHSNGYSLIRKWLDERPEQVNHDLIQNLLRPTRVYSELIKLSENLSPGTIHSCANITGGGFSGNIPRVLPKGAVADIEKSAVNTDGWMAEFIQSNGFDDIWDLEAVFNLGVGMTLIIDASKKEEFEIQAKGLEAYPIGKVRIGKDQSPAQIKLT